MTEKFKFDAYDLDALEKSLNDSAVRVSTIWVSFLIFALYLIIALGTVTHRQILLEEPIRLPVLNIDLPLWGFFFLAPILFVIFHGYVLLQVVLLGRTAAAYNETVDRAVKSPPKNASIRQRLANTLFAQIFAGSPRERQGIIGGLLRVMAWVTLAIAPVLVLFVFQFKFLPYQSHFVTWAQRLLILTELIAIFLLWPLVLDAEREIEWRRLVWHPLTFASAVLFVLISLCVATFPGEPHVNIFIGRSVTAVECERWFARFDRLDLPRVDVVDDQKLTRIESEARARGLAANQREPTQQFSGRNLRCGKFEGADFRGIDFTSADLQGSILREADLKDTILERAQLGRAVISRAKLQGAVLTDAGLQGADLSDVQLTGAWLSGAQLQTANLDSAELPGAILYNVRLDGSSLRKANLEGSHFFSAGLVGARLDDANLQGASLSLSDLRGASFEDARLDGSAFYGSQMAGASLRRAGLQGALLYSVSMQGVNFDGTQLQGSKIFNIRVWGANGIPKLDLTDLQEIDANSTPWGENSSFAEWRDEIESIFPTKSAARESLARRFATIDPSVKNHPSGLLDADFWEKAHTAQVQGEKALIGRAAFLARLACAQSAAWIARNLFREIGFPLGGVANIQGWQALVVAERLRKGRSDLAACPGAKDLSDTELEKMSKARVQYEESAGKGDVNAMTVLGWLYHNGHGVEQDDIKAREWYEKAASKGNAYAMTFLGWLYETVMASSRTTSRRANGTRRPLARAT